MKTNLYDAGRFSRLMAIIMAFIIAPWITMAQDTVVIGDTAGRFASYYQPVTGSYEYGFSYHIYKGTEMDGKFGKINSISQFNWRENADLTLENQKIYFLSVPNSKFPNNNYIDPVAVGATLVYDGSFAVKGYGWQEIQLTTPFVYTGGNVMVIWENYNGTSVTTTDAPYWAIEDAYSSYSAVYKYANSSFPAGITGGGNGRRSTVRFTFGDLDPVDMKLVGVSNPVTGILPNSNEPISFALQNNGALTQTSFEVSYSVDGGYNFTTEQITTNLASAEVMNYTFNSSIDMSAPGLYNCVFVVSAAGEANPSNDTIYSDIWVGYPVSGTFTVGADVDDDFSTINEAVEYLQRFGVNGPVQISIDAGTFNEHVTLENIPGTSSENTVTFKGQGDNTIISSKETNGIAVFEVVDNMHVIIDSLAVKPIEGDDGTITGIRLIRSDSITIKNCLIEGSNTGESYNSRSVGIAGGRVANAAESTDGYKFSKLNIENNRILGSFNYGIAIHGKDKYSYRGKSFTFRDNHIEGFRTRGIYANYTKDFIVTGNLIIDGGLTSRPAGIYVTYAKGGEFSYNKVIIYTLGNSSSAAVGIRFYDVQGSSTKSVLVYNNDVIAFGPAATTGLYAYYCADMDILYNTVRVTGNTSSEALYFSYYKTTWSNVNIANNNFISTGAGIAAVYGSKNYFVNQQITLSDYNNYYVPDGYNLLKASSKAYKTLAEWQNEFEGYDENSVDFDPVFTSEEHSIPSSSFLNNKGLASSSVTDDITGATRGTSPDIGAYEFDAFATDVVLTKYIGITDVNCGLGANVAVEVVLANNGSSTLTKLPIKYTVNGGAVVVDTLASLEAGVVDTFVFAVNADMTAYGLYNVHVYTDLTADANPNNNSLKATVEHVSKLDLSAVPFVLDFESDFTEFGPVAAKGTMVEVDTVGVAGTQGLKMEGLVSVPWINGYNFAQALERNPDHLAAFQACDVDATSMTGKEFGLTFDVSLQNSGGYYYQYFWVSVNDSIFLKDSEGDSIFQRTSRGIDPFKNLYFDLSTFAGTSFDLKLNALLAKGGTGDNNVDAVYVDNLSIVEVLKEDVGVVALDKPVSGICNVSSSPVLVSVENFGTDTVFNVPVVADFVSPEGNLMKVESAVDTIAPGAVVLVEMGEINTTESGVYMVKAYTNLSTDLINKHNDTLIASFEMDTLGLLPEYEDFESGYGNWTGDFSRTSRNDETGHTLYKSSMGPNSIFNEYMTYRLGEIKANHNFTMDFWFTSNDYSSRYAMTEMREGDTLLVLITSACVDFGNMDTLVAIDSVAYNIDTTGNDIPHTIAASLTDYIGDTVHIQIQMKNGSTIGYNRFYMDNIGIVNSVEKPNLGNDTALCFGDVLTLGVEAVEDRSYMWVYDGDTLETTESYLDADMAGTYVLSISNAVNTESDTIVISEVALPAVSITGLASSYYITEPVDTLSGTPIGGAFSGNGMVDSLFTPATAGIGTHDITYTYTDPTTTCTNTAVSAVEVFELEVTPDLGSCSGDDVVLTAYVTEDQSAMPTYAWSTGASTASITVNPTVETTYKVTVSNANYTAVDSVKVTMMSTPAVVFDPATTVFCNNDLGEQLTATPANGTFTGTGVNGNVFFPEDAGVGTHTITYTYNSAGFCPAVVTADMTVNESPVVTMSANDTICVGETGTVFGHGTGFVKYLWNTGDETAVLSIDPLQTTTYTLSVSNSLCTSVDSVDIFVNALPDAGFSGLALSYCDNGDAATLTPVNSGGTFSGNGVSGYTFDPSVATAGTHEIVYVYTDANSCTNSSAQTTLVNAAPVITMSADHAICIGETTTLAASAEGTNIGYIWSTGDMTDTIDVTPTATTTYYVTVYDDNCASVDSVTVTVNELPVVSFEGLDAAYCENHGATAALTGTPAGGTFSGNGITGNDFDPAVAGVGTHEITYTYTESTTGCTNSTMNSTTVNAAPVVIMSNDTSICINDSVMISATGEANNTYLWSTGATDSAIYVDPVVATTYTVTVSNDAACSTIDEVVVSVNNLPVVSFTGLAEEYCNDAAADQLVGAPEGGTFTGTGVAGDNFDPEIADLGENVVTYTYTDANQCTNSATDTATVYEAIAVAMTNDTIVCAGESVTISGTVTSDVSVATPTYEWSTGETTSVITVMPTVTTTYTLTVSNPSCSYVDSVVVEAKALPVVDLGADQAIKWTYGSVELDAGNPGATYLWNDGDTTQTNVYSSVEGNLGNGTNNGDSVNVVYVEVTVDGCTSSDTVLITVTDDVAISNVLSNVGMNIYPNPSNGQFVLTITGLTGDVDMEIVNLAGQSVHTETINVTENTKFSFDERQLAKGVYYIRLSHENGVKTKKLIIN